MKKLFIIIVIIIATYFIIAGVLTATGVCPKYVNLMPRVVGPGIEDIKGPNDPQAWHLFCPFVEKSY
ncbi:MAG: hypothetical protein WC884_01345 [Candidatus Paceibacterota bacterium]